MNTTDGVCVLRNWHDGANADWLLICRVESGVVSNITLAAGVY